MLKAASCLAVIPTVTLIEFTLAAPATVVPRK